MCSRDDGARPHPPEGRLVRARKEQVLWPSTGRACRTDALLPGSTGVGKLLQRGPGRKWGGLGATGLLATPASSSPPRACAHHPISVVLAGTGPGLDWPGVRTLQTDHPRQLYSLTWSTRTTSRLLDLIFPAFPELPVPTKAPSCRTKARPGRLLAFRSSQRWRRLLLTP